VTSTGKFDPRVWFAIPVSLNLDSGFGVTYITFPFGASEDEIVEVSI